MHAESEVRALWLRRCEAGLQRGNLLCERRAGSHQYAQVDQRSQDIIGHAQSFLHIARRSYFELGQVVFQIPTTQLEKSFTEWHDVVDQYSALQLTKDTGRLPALSGLAERMPFLGRYHAGLCESSLLYDMIWRVDKLPYGLGRPAKYRGPFWSWVSVNTRVRFWSKSEMSLRSVFGRLAEDLRLHPSMGSNVLSPRKAGEGSSTTVDDAASEQEAGFKLLSSVVTPQGKNPYGEVSSGIIVAEGMLGPAMLLDKSKTFEDSPDLPRFAVNITFHDTLAPSLSFPFFADYVWTDDGPHKVQTGRRDDVFLLMIFCDIGLVLTKTPIALKGGVPVFRRVGILKFPTEYEATYGIEVIKDSHLAKTKVAII